MVGSEKGVRASRCRVTALEKLAREESSEMETMVGCGAGVGNGCRDEE